MPSRLKTNPHFHHRGGVMKRFPFRLLLLCATVALLAVAARADKPAKNDETSRFFADKKAVPKFVITPDEAALKSLRQDPRKKVPVSVAIDGVEYKDVS